MSRNIWSFFSRRIRSIALVIAVLTAGVAAHALQAKPGVGRIGNTDAQQEQLQQQQLQQEQLALTGRQNDLRNLPILMEEMEAERDRLKYLLRANFRQHYATIRKNSADLVDLTSNLQTSTEGDLDAANVRDILAETKSVQKLAHEILETMAGRKLHKPDAGSSASSTGSVGLGLADHRKLLIDKTSQAKTSAADLKKAIDDYLASDNDQTVSVGALQKPADKDRFDPNLVTIINAAAKLQKLADEIRSELRLINTLQ